jgi:hypothetical protein
MSNTKRTLMEDPPGTNQPLEEQRPAKKPRTEEFESLPKNLVQSWAEQLYGSDKVKVDYEELKEWYTKGPDGDWSLFVDGRIQALRDERLNREEKDREERLVRQEKDRVKPMLKLKLVGSAVDLDSALGCIHDSFFLDKKSFKKAEMEATTLALSDLFESNTKIITRVVDWISKEVQLVSIKESQKEEFDATKVNVSVKSKTFTIPENLAISEFFPLKVIFERESYDAHFKEIVRLLKSGSSVIVIGDPGCGKTTLLRYAFVRIMRETVYRHKVFWVSESGRWLYWDGLTKAAKYGNGPTDIWKADDVWLFIDGHAEDVYLQKSVSGACLV